MKKMFIACIMAMAILSWTGELRAASSMTVQTPVMSNNRDFVVVPILCVAHTDGTFTDKQITEAEIGFAYQKEGYRLAHAYAINSTTDDHTNAAVVTIYDETGQVLIGSQSGDTLTLSQAAYNATTHAGIAYLSVDRASSQRAINSLLSIGIADTGSTATSQTIYIIFQR